MLLRPVAGGLSSESREEAVAGGMTLKAVPVGGTLVSYGTGCIVGTIDLAACLARKLPDAGVEIFGAEEADAPPAKVGR